ncbi:uncharacterized protein [Diadema antillarum]|uniref:uncharacterized protein n=1 Tax=Diadema antillarum TaxID=105358 RepID=UPI003A878DB2
MNGWVDGMEKCVGLQGEVSGVDIHKNARVKLVGIMNELSWHPCTLEILKKISPDAPASDILPGLDDAEVFTKALMSLLGIHADDESDSSSSPSSDDSGDKKDEEFMEVAKAGKVERVVEIITESPDRVNHKVNGKTALHRASLQGHIDVVMALMEAGADANATDSSGNTPVIFAAEGDEPAVVKYLVGKGADVNQGNKNGRRAVHCAAYKGLADCMRILINSGCDVNLQDDDGDTAIHDAVNKGGVDVVELLLGSRELDLALTNKRDLTPLQFAAFLDRPSEAELIVKAFPKSIIIPREDGNTVLHIAAVNNHAEVIKKILAVQDHGLCLDSKNEDALTALHLACAKGQTQCIELLVTEGADVNCQGKDDQGALHLVALSSRSEEDVEVKDTPTLQKIRQTYQKHGCKDAASALLIFMVKHGASVTLENMKCRTPLSYVKDQQLRATLKKIARGESVSDDGVDMSTWEDLGEDEDVKTGRLGGDPVDEVENNIVDDAQTAGRTRRRSERVSEEEPKETGSASKTTGSGLAGTSSPGVKVFDLVHQVGAQELDLGDVIGSGQFGTVYRAVWHGTPVAVKKISFLGSKQSEVEKEVAIHRRASHPNIVQMMALGYEGLHAYLVMQLIDGNALADILFPTKSGQKKMSLSRKEKLQISRGILQAVSYMHACNILHLDIKPANILIETLTKRPYICDLGLAHIKNRNAMSQSSVHMRGTPCYMPPETLSPTPDAKHSNKHDVWSVAGTLVELHSGQHLWGKGPIHPLAFLAQMTTGIGGTPQALAKVESGMRRILEPCFKRDPDQRPSAQQLLEKFNALT